MVTYEQGTIEFSQELWKLFGAIEEEEDEPEED